MSGLVISTSITSSLCLKNRTQCRSRRAPTTSPALAGPSLGTTEKTGFRRNGSCANGRAESPRQCGIALSRRTQTLDDAFSGDQQIHLVGIKEIGTLRTDVRKVTRRPCALRSTARWGALWIRPRCPTCQVTCDYSVRSFAEYRFSRAISLAAAVGARTPC